LTGKLHICAPSPVATRLARVACDFCGCDRYHVGFLFEWYGWHLICLRCGEESSGGEYLERPFAPGWRGKNKARARKLWRSMGAVR
jgi:hypothetical protein